MRSGSVRRDPGRRLRPIALLPLLLGICVAAHADWRRDYDFGQEAMQKGKWAEAESLMRSAMAEEPGASARKRFQGTRFALYAPSHYAGVAAFKQGSCPRALDYFNDGSTRDVVAQLGNLATEEQQVRLACEGQLASSGAAEPPKPTAPATAPTEKPAVADARRNPPPIETKPVVAAPVKPPPVATPSPPPVTPVVTQSAAPTALRSIVNAFLVGNYDAALQTSDAGVGDARGRALLLLVRAAAGFTRADLQGGDATLQSRAEHDVQASRRFARIDPDPNLFSPKIRALFARVR